MQFPSETGSGYCSDALLTRDIRRIASIAARISGVNALEISSGIVGARNGSSVINSGIGVI